MTPSTERYVTNVDNMSPGVLGYRPDWIWWFSFSEQHSYVILLLTKLSSNIVSASSLMILDMGQAHVELQRIGCPQSKQWRVLLRPPLSSTPKK